MRVAGGVGFLGYKGVPRGNFNMQTLDIAPRFGYAYRLTNRIVWRGGYGLFLIPNNVSNFRYDGYSFTTNMVTSLNNNITPFNTLSNPFPNGLVQPAGPGGGPLTGVGQSLTENLIAAGGQLPDYRHGMSQQFSTGFQVVLPPASHWKRRSWANRSQRLPVSRISINIPTSSLRSAIA